MEYESDASWYLEGVSEKLDQAHLETMDLEQDTQDNYEVKELLDAAHAQLRESEEYIRTAYENFFDSYQKFLKDQSSLHELLPEE